MNTLCKIIGCKIDGQVCQRCGEHEYYGVLSPGWHRWIWWKITHPFRGWHWTYWYRRWLGWIPLQPCMGCGKWYWGGIPWRGWQACYQEFCSKKCHDDNDIPF